MNSSMGDGCSQRFRQEIREMFQLWLETHEEDPYPTADQIKQWAIETNEQESMV